MSSVELAQRVVKVNKLLTLTALQTKTNTLANGVDPDRQFIMSNRLSHLELNCHYGLVFLSYLHFNTSDLGMQESVRSFVCPDVHSCI